jgi:hypothetical protein
MRVIQNSKNSRFNYIFATEGDKSTHLHFLVHFARRMNTFTSSQQAQARKEPALVVSNYRGATL